MAAITLVFLALVSVTLVHGQDPRCTTKVWGDLSGTPVPLPDTTLPPPNPSYTLSIPNVCNGQPPQGLMVTVCDPNGPPPPTVSISSTSAVYVQRNSYPITLPATVQTTAYCTYPPTLMGRAQAPRATPTTSRRH